MLTLVSFSFVTDFYSFFLPLIAQILQCLYVWNKFQEVKNILHCKLHYILVWNILIVSFMYLELNWNMSAVSVFSYHWYSIFYAKKYHLVYYNGQQLYLATLVSFDISVFSLNIVQFVVRTRSNKNYKMRHTRKKIMG